MPRKYIGTLFFILLSVGVLLLSNSFQSKSKTESNKYYPSDWFFMQRAYPERELNFEKYFTAVKKVQQFKKIFNFTLAQKWNQVGPTNIGGRITALDVVPTNPKIIYIGAAAGGVFKSTDGGFTWYAKTDHFPSLSSGAIKIDPNNTDIIYFGSGEANSSGDSYPGFGMLKSTDAGGTWFHSGLDSVRHISKMEIHPSNSNLIFVAAAGGLYSKGIHRGVYRSENGGASWERVLFLNDSTSAIDVAIDPIDTNIVYASMWERLRGPTFRKVAGFSSGIYKSTDKGNSWNRLVNGLPGALNTIGRIAIAVSNSNPNYIYALYRKSTAPNGDINIFEGFYRSTNKGLTWTKMSATGISGFASFGWYFGMMEVDPTDHNKLYLGDIDIFKTTNGGVSFTNITNSYSGSFLQQHPDQHALWINPSNTNIIYNGNDGGFFISTNQGASWNKKFDLPISQFYASTIDYLLPFRKYGGTQDNGTLGTRAGGINDWEELYGGDGFHCIVDYTNSNILYAEYQFGGLGKSTNGGSTFFSATNGISSSDRFNWSTPYVMDEKNPNVLFYGSNKIYQTTNGAQSWNAISGDLTRGRNGRLGTISSISTTALPDGKRVVYVGTDDAKVWVSTNTGTTWTDISGTLPMRYVTRIECNKGNPGTAYVTLSGYNIDETSSHVFRTVNYGNTWIDIGTNLPNVPVNDIIIDYNHDSVLYVGCDVGVFYSTNLGGVWNILGSDLPNSPVFDLSYHQPTKKLIAATHGRSMFEFDLSSIQTDVKSELKIELIDFVLYQNYPNPFSAEGISASGGNPITNIKFNIPHSALVSLKVYDILGKEISTLVNEVKEAGTHNSTFRISSSSFPSGIYFYKLKVGNTERVKKFVYLR